MKKMMMLLVMVFEHPRQTGARRKLGGIVGGSVVMND